MVYVVRASVKLFSDGDTERKVVTVMKLVQSLPALQTERKWVQGVISD